MDDILKIIPDESLPRLRNILRKEFPENMHVYYFIETSIQLKKNRPNENYITFYCPEGDFSDGTFIAIIEMYCYDILIYTMDKTLSRLKRALCETKIIDFERKPEFCAVFLTYRNMAYEIKDKIHNFFVHELPSHVWYLSKEKALEYEYSIPAEIYLAPLHEFHATTLNECWPHKSEGSQRYLAKVIELNGGVGLFFKQNDELCAWVLKNYFGGLGVLQVSEKHKRKGYGSLIAKIFSKMIAENDGFDITGFVVTKNVPSIEMFKKLGFKKSTAVTWLYDYK